MLHIENLPYDLILEIFSYLNTSDVIAFCEAIPNFSWCFEDSVIVKTVDISEKYCLTSFNLNKFFTRTLRVDYVKTLNINCIYWISAQNFRDILKKMTNLENLMALDTKLSLSLLDCEVYKNLHLQRLALTVDPGDDINHYPENYLPFLKALVFKFCTVKFLKAEDYYRINRFLLKIHRTLEEIWFIGGQVLQYLYTIQNLPNLKKLVIKSKTVPSFNFNHIGLFKVFQKTKLDSCEIVFQKNSNVYLENPNKNQKCLNESNPWMILNDLHCEMPYGVCDAIKLANKIDRLSTIKFDELNFYHTPILCIPRYIEATIGILKSVNAQNIRKLSISSCCFIQEADVNKEPSVSTGFKRTRNGVQILPSNPFKTIAENLNKLVELEVWYCTKPTVASEQIFNAYNAINCFKNLKQLTIEVPTISNGSYLNDLIENCVELESLRIKSLGRNMELNFNLCKCIKGAKNLKDFRFSTMYIAIDNLFESLNCIINSRLERVFLKFETVSKFSSGPLKLFLKNNKQLVFFIILIKNCTKEIMKQVEKTLNTAKNKDRTKVFYARRQLEDLLPSFAIPLAHQDLLKCKSKIGIVNIYEQFK